MTRWFPKILAEVHRSASEGSVLLTLKALRESVSMGLAPEDVRDVIGSLTAADSTGRLRSKSTGEWMHVFKPRVGDEVVYVKLIVREDCVVVSFHEDEGGHEDA